VSTHKNENFADQAVELDGSSFDHCTFEDCQLIFRGSAPVSLVECGFMECDWQFADVAALTVKFIGDLDRSTGSQGTFLKIVFG